jgi:hypothetical protein
MRNTTLARLFFASVLAGTAACSDGGVSIHPSRDAAATDGALGSGGRLGMDSAVIDGSFITEAGGAGGAPGVDGGGRSGAPEVGGVLGPGGGGPLQLPDGGLGALLGDAGLAGLVGGLLGDGGLAALLGDAGLTGLLGDAPLSLPDGGLGSFLGDASLTSLLDDSGIVNGILDAPRDSVVGQIICGNEVKLGAACSTDSLGCVLPSGGGACACLGGIYICPASTTAGPQTCPADAVNGGKCTTPMALCTGAGTKACFCVLGTYVCS